MAVSLAKPLPLSAEELKEIATTIDGKIELPGWQTRLARILDANSERSVIPSQISLWTNPLSDRKPPWWATGPCYLALINTSI